MVPMSTSTTASMVRMPKLCSASSSSTSSPVMTTAQNSGMWNSRFSATALPSTSARSQAATASSLSSQLGQRVQRGIPVAAALRQVFAGDDAEPRGDHLHEDGHEAGEADDPEQAVLELRSGLQVGAPVAGVHVADADQDGRADERAPLLPESGLVVGNGDGAVHALERGVMAGRGGAKRSGIECCVCPLWCSSLPCLCYALKRAQITTLFYVARRRFDRPCAATLLFDFKRLVVSPRRIANNHYESPRPR